MSSNPGSSSGSSLSSYQVKAAGSSRQNTLQDKGKATSCPTEAKEDPKITAIRVMILLLAPHEGLLSHRLLPLANV